MADSSRDVPRIRHAPELATFHDQLREQLRHAPWMAVSLIAHGILFLILNALVFQEPRTRTAAVIHADLLAEDVEPMVAEIELPPPQVSQESREFPEDPQVSEEVVEELAPADPWPLAPVTSDPVPLLIGVGGRTGGFEGKYRKRVGVPGGTASQSAVDHGLAWLARHQDPGGFWDCDGFPDRCTSGLCSGRGDALNDVGVTGIALLAFLGAGNTKAVGPHRSVVKSGLHWLEWVQDREDGCFGPKTGQHFLYGHALATLAMVEGYHLSGEPLLRDPAQKGLDFIAKARNPSRAWRYAYPPDGQNDTSITGWMLFALFAGRDAGLEVDAAALADGMAFLRELTDPATGRTGYQRPGQPPAREPGDVEQWPPERSESLTAVALLLRVFDGEDPQRSEVMRKGADLLLHRLPTWEEDTGDIDYYYWYYGSYALWQLSGEHWKTWQRKMLDSVVAHQRPDGDEKGSWDPEVDPWGSDGGRVYATALNTLTLEVYYRYDRILGAR